MNIDSAKNMPSKYLIDSAVQDELCGWKRRGERGGAAEDGGRNGLMRFVEDDLSAETLKAREEFDTPKVLRI